MANDKTEIEKKWLADVIIPEALEKSKFTDSETQQAISSNEFQLKDIEIRFIGYEEAFMLTTCYRATIFYQYKGQAKECHLVVKKTPPIPEDMFNAINFGPLFHNEVTGYGEAIPALEKFAQTTLNVCRCFYSNMANNHAEIVLEDFATKSFRVAKDRYNLSLAHALLAVKYLGKFHSIGFALRQKHPEQYESLTDKLRESRFTSNEFHGTWKLVQETGIKRMKLATQKYQPGVNSGFLERLYSRITNLMAFGKSMVKPKEPYVTLCHGDYLRNNIAFKYAPDNTAERSEVPVDVMMFDLQTLRSCSPMIDLAVFLGLSTLTAVRCEHFEKIFNTYVDELRSGYEKFSGEKPPEFLGYDALLKEYIRFLPYSISIASTFLFTLVDPIQMSPDEYLMMDKSEEEIVADVQGRGGTIVDQELAHQVAEFHELSRKHGIDVE